MPAATYSSEQRTKTGNNNIHDFIFNRSHTVWIYSHIRIPIGIHSYGRYFLLDTPTFYLIGFWSAVYGI
jgi:hypothetical protein